MYLAKRLEKFGVRVMIGASTRCSRMTAARAVIAVNELAAKRFGKNAAGVVETYADFFLRLYGEQIHVEQPA